MTSYSSICLREGGQLYSSCSGFRDWFPWSCFQGLQCSNMLNLGISEISALRASKLLILLTEEQYQLTVWGVRKHSHGTASLRTKGSSRSFLAECGGQHSPTKFLVLSSWGVQETNTRVWTALQFQMACTTR